jgi:general secretion pathway protein K
MIGRMKASASAVRESMRAGPRSGRSPHGVALLLVLVTMAIMAAFTTEFHYKSYVSLHVASNLRDDVTAYYHARSAMEVARLVIKSQNVADNMFNALAAFVPNIKNQNIELWTFACEFANAFCSGKLKLMGKTFFDFTGMKGVGLEKGGFCKCRAMPEDGRINVNRVDSLAEKNQMFADLYSTFIQFREEPLTDLREIDKDVAELVLNIIDWADPDSMRSDLVGTMVHDSAQAEGLGYDKGFTPKNGKFDTLRELLLVDKMDRKLYCQAARELTPYSTKKLNVNTAPLRTLRRLTCAHTTNAEEVCYGLGGQQVPTMDFAMYCMEMCRTLRQALMSPGFSNTGQFMKFFDLLPAEWQPRPILDKRALTQKIGVKSRVIRVETTGGYYTTFRSLTGIIDSSTGDYVYWREY